MVRVAIIGAGPAGFFAAEELLKSRAVQVDLFDRLPAPYGLVRHGVAPDHPGIKSITERYDESAREAGTRFRLLGNVAIGRDLTLPELRARYHAVILAHGAQASRTLGVPGEDLAGVHQAASFVGWYNGHPDRAARAFDLSAPRAVVVGVGNVALDVARVLVRPLDELSRTDMSDRALEVLARRAVREVVLLGRQGPAQAAFTPPELSELGEIADADLVIAPEDRALDPETAARQARGTLDAPTERKLAAVEKARTAPREGRKVVRVRLWSSPVEFLGEAGRLTGIRVRRNAMVQGPDGALRLEPTERTEILECGLAFLSLGYRVEPLAGVPFDAALGTVPHRRGQILDSGAPVPGLFVAGWAKRGARGVIGSNKPDAQETVRALFDAFKAGALPAPQVEEDVEALLAARGVGFVSYPDWRLLDLLEVEAGRPAGRPRRKFTDAESMLEALAQTRPDDRHQGG